ncbi:ATP-binding protein [Nostoc sp.]|uniref:ATP-binding protein n=1 Tax=Nostoc sp. TaxID=1180 RepID=UPI002FF8F9EB
MKVSQNIIIQGIPNNVPEDIAAVFRSRILSATNKLVDETNLEKINIIVTTASEARNIAEENSIKKTEANNHKSNNNDLSVEERASKYKAVQPLFNFEQLVITEQVKDDLLLAVDLINLEAKVFDDWGLRQIEPFPRTALNFYGSSGTGKTLSAHAIASKIKRPILAASYAQIESMYHGEGPKNLEAIFLAAERDNALLFIDEADSLLSKRLTNVTQGSEQAINSMRSQLLICLERFRGVVIFCTNLVENYDKAFETRVRHVHFLMPDFASRREIWKRHLPTKMPLAEDISPEKLAQVEDVCGRDIKNAVIDAAMRVARKGKFYVELSDLLDSINKIKSARINVLQSDDLSPHTREKISPQLKEALSQKELEST